jgi:hypothetical protein
VAETGTGVAGLLNGNPHGAHLAPARPQRTSSLEALRYE